MIRRYIKLSVLIFTIALLMPGCAGSVREIDPICKTYVYENDGFGGDFTITIDDDGSFSYYEGALSSHIGDGEWTLEGDTLILSENGESPRVYYFKVDENDLVFTDENSSDFLYVKVSDGERFSGSLTEPSDES